MPAFHRVLRSYLPETERLIGRMTTRPDHLRSAIYNDFFKTLRRESSNPLAKLDVLYVGAAAPEAQGSYQNFIENRFNLTPSATPPTFTANQGWTGVPASSTNLTASGYNPSTLAGLKYTLNDACAGIYTRTAQTYNGSSGGLELSTGTGRMQRRSTTNDTHYSFRINDGTNNNGAVAAQTGHFTTQRTASDARELFRNATSVTTNTVASTTVGNSFVLLGVAGAYADVQLSAGYAGGALTTGELTALHNALITMLTNVGAI